jgi:hypothetical protein
VTTEKDRDCELSWKSGETSVFTNRLGIVFVSAPATTPKAVKECSLGYVAMSGRELYFLLWNRKEDALFGQALP